MKIKQITENLKFGIYATVSGGATGTRTAWVRKDGNRIEVDSYEEAEQIANEYMKMSNNRSHATASYRYEPMEIDY